jgi:hypothetical protein
VEVYFINKGPDCGPVWRYPMRRLAEWSLMSTPVLFLKLQRNLLAHGQSNQLGRK